MRLNLGHRLTDFLYSPDPDLGLHPHAEGLECDVFLHLIVSFNTVVVGGPLEKQIPDPLVDVVVVWALVHVDL